MFRILTLLTGFTLIAAGFALAVVDGSRSLSADKPMFTSLKVLIELVNAGFELRLKPVITGLASFLWDPVSTGLLATPAFLAFWVVGFTLYLIGRRRPALIGYSNRG